jgi:hypothetical protein
MIASSIRTVASNVIMVAAGAGADGAALGGEDIAEDEPTTMVVGCCPAGVGAARHPAAAKTSSSAGARALRQAILIAGSSDPFLAETS